MSLLISLATANHKTGEMIKSDPFSLDGRDMAGFESWRTKVYGSSTLTRRGAQFLPQLAKTNLWVCGNDLIEFLKEVESLLIDIEQIADELDIDHQTLIARFQNIFNAIKDAIEEDKGVWIS